MTAQAHVPTPEDELDQGVYDVCAHCQLPIVQHWQDRAVWVVMTTGSRVCYGRTS